MLGVDVQKAKRAEEEKRKTIKGGEGRGFKYSRALDSAAGADGV